MGRLERNFQSHLIRRLKDLVGDRGDVLKLDCNYRQGIPDLLVLYRKKYAILECKKSPDEPFEPNQEWYLDYFNRLAFASVIYPEIEEEVIYDLQQALRIR